MLLVKTLKCMFLIKNLRVYTIGKSSAVFSLRGPLCATFPYYVSYASTQCHSLLCSFGRNLPRFCMGARIIAAFRVTIHPHFFLLYFFTSNFFSNFKNKILDARVLGFGIVIVYSIVTALHVLYMRFIRCA